jgi:hypothetical protein
MYATQSFLQATSRIQTSLQRSQALHSGEGLSRLQLHRSHTWATWKHSEAHGGSKNLENCQLYCQDLRLQILNAKQNLQEFPNQNDPSFVQQIYVFKSRQAADMKLCSLR